MSRAKRPGCFLASGTLGRVETRFVLSRLTLMNHCKMFTVAARGFAASVALLTITGCGGSDLSPLTNGDGIQEGIGGIGRADALEQGLWHPPDPPAPLPVGSLGGEDIFFPASTASEGGAGTWVGLFDGYTLFGWGGRSPRGLSVRDGAIVTTGLERGHSPDLVHRAPLLDGVVAWSYQCEARGDVGVVLQDSLPAAEASPRARDLRREPTAGWITGSVTARGSEVVITVGEEAYEGVFADPFLLVLHGREARLRGIRYRPHTLPLDLTTFTPVSGSDCEITRDGDTLRLTGGPGYLRSAGTYGDFVLQCEVLLHGTDSNSGIFFRAMEPTEKDPANGYEVQLQNTLADGDRTKPADYGDGFGTGAIFRRQAARYVNADDGEWFALTLVCVGNRMATWVNGLQVTDFEDTREFDVNPRKGRRDDAGYLILQAHDPGTDVSFRNLRVGRLNEN